MSTRSLLPLLGLIVISFHSAANAADKKQAKVAAPNTNGVTFGKITTQRWQVGVILNTKNGACRDIVATVPVPTDWPEQKVRIVDEEISSFAHVDYRMLDNGVKQLVVSIPQLPYGQIAKVLITFEVDRSQVIAPADPSVFTIPKKIPREFGKYLAASPYIETRNPDIIKVAREAVEGKDSAWDQVEAIYDWVRGHVTYQNGKLKGAAAALKDKTGDCEEMTSLFIAMCRIHKIPARTVWIPDHCYPEFYLTDNEGQGHWIPCQAAGTRDFGNMPEFRPVLQKGDNFTVPDQKKPQRYVAEFLTGKPAVQGGRPPGHEFIRKLMNLP